MIEVKKVVEKWEIQDDDDEAVRLEKEVKKLVLKKFHRWIKVFDKKQSERIPTRKVQSHTIDLKKGFMPRKRKVYLLSREEVKEFVKRQLRKGYIRLSKLPQTASMFFIEKKNGKKRMV